VAAPSSAQRIVLMSANTPPSGAGALLSSLQLAAAPVDHGGDATGVRDSSRAFEETERSSNVCVLTPGTWLISRDVTLSKAWRILSGGVIRPANGVTVTITGEFDASFVQCIDLSLGGAVAFPAGVGIEKACVEWWGGRGDDATDNAAALTAAAVAAATARVPMGILGGTYRFASAQTWTNVPGIAGRGTFKPTAALNAGTAITINNDPVAFTATFDWGDVLVDGSLTAGTRGVLVGGNALSGMMRFRGGMIKYFRSAGGRGLVLRNIVQFSAEHHLVGSNYLNVEIDGGDSSFPTAVRFSTCNIREADTDGMWVRNAHQVVLDQNTVVESNGERAVLVTPGAGRNVLQLDFNHAWFENNWLSLSADPVNRALEYAIEVDSAASIALTGFEMHSCRHGEVCRIADINGAVDCVIDAPYRPGGSANDFNIRGGAVVHLVNWPDALPLPVRDATAVVRIEGKIVFTATLNPDPLAAGGRVSVDYAVPGVALGDQVGVSFSVDALDIRAWGYVLSAGNVRVWIENPTAGIVNLPEMTLNIRAWR
jgi:hypothetical protein